MKRFHPQIVCNNAVFKGPTLIAGELNVKQANNMMDIRGCMLAPHKVEQLDSPSGEKKSGKKKSIARDAKRRD